MDIRRACPADIPAILQLQEANLFANLTPEQRVDGFLSARFSGEQFARMAQEVAVLVAVDRGHVAGYLCASGLEFNRQFPLLAAMLGEFGRIDFLGRSLSAQRCFIYGPVCIDRALRGRGLLSGLYRMLRNTIGTGYDAGVAFVAQDNARSLSTHAEGLGMSIVGEFAFDAKRYWVLAFEIPPTPSD